MMFRLLYSTKFVRKLRKMLQRNPHIGQKVYDTLKKLRQNPFDRSLETHKAANPQGQVIFSSRVTQDLRITWNVHKEKTRVLDILDIGGHSGRRKVYK